MARPGVTPPSCRSLFRDGPHALRARRARAAFSPATRRSGPTPAARGRPRGRAPVGRREAASSASGRSPRGAVPVPLMLQVGCSAAAFDWRVRPGPAQNAAAPQGRRRGRCSPPIGVRALLAAAPHSRSLWRSGLARRGRLPVAGDDCGCRGLATVLDQQAGNPLPKTHRQPAAGWRGVRSCAIAPPRHRYPAAPHRRGTALAGV